MDGEKRKLPAPVTTTEEFLHAAVIELRALTAAVERLAGELEPVALVEADQVETPADEAAPKKGRKKVAE